MLKTKSQTVQVPATLVCDRCGIEVEADEFDYQEFLRIDFVGGYSSIFGDEQHVQCDLCQDCVKERLGDFLQIKER